MGMFRQDWDALATRIDGLVETGTFVLQSAPAVGSDYYGVLNAVVLPNATETYLLLERFHANHEKSMPPAAATALKRFIDLQGAFFRDKKPTGFPALQGMVALLQSVRTEVTHHLSDLAAGQRRRVELGFEHLRRSLVVDDQLATRWKKAFETHETHCERLGAVHLLSHGLWAFKANEAGAATDLLLGSPLDLDRVEASAEALVLTEWKRVTNAKDLPDHLTKARSQAAKYASGILGGIELRSYRYLVFVTEADLPMPTDIRENEVVYRHINIPVAPKSPSKA
ncbi:MAG: hypothetical protein ABTQ32_04470 [Myxococcaceae bacterium]